MDTALNIAGSRFTAGSPLTYAPVYFWTWAIVLLDSMGIFFVRTDAGTCLLLSLLFAGLYTFAVKQGRNYAADPEKHKAAEKISDGFAILGTVIFVMYLITQQTITGLLTLLLFLQAALLCRLATTRELYFTLMASFVILLFCVATTKSGFFLVLIVAYLLALMALLHAIFTQSKHTEAAACLDTAQSRSAMACMVISILAVSSLLYLSLPRPVPLHINGFISDGGQNYNNESWYDEAKEDGDEPPEPNGKNSPPADNPPSKTDHPYQYPGFNNEFSINKTQEGAGLGNPIVLYLQTDKPLYLRGNIFDYFDGVTWKTSDAGNRKIRLHGGFYSFDSDTFDPKHRDQLTRQVIEVAETLGNRLFASPKIIELNFPGSVFAKDSYGNLYVPSELVAGTRYDIRSLTEFAREHLIADKTGMEDFSAYLQLPQNQSPKVKELAQQVTKATSDALQAALLLEDHLRSHYQYDLQSVFSSQNHTPVETFLFDTKKGHCEYFASTLTVLLRSLNIPARYVTGYSYGSYNPVTGYHEIRALDGHAWVEAWIKGIGWVSFEPTPGFAMQKPDENAPVESTAKKLETYAEQTKQALLHSPEDLAAEMKILLAETFIRARQTVERALNAAYHLLLSVLASTYPLLLGLALLGVLGYLFRVQLLNALALQRIKHLHKKPPNTQVLALWHELEQWMARSGHERKSSETAYEYTVRLINLSPEAEQALGVLAGFFYEANYSPAILTADAAGLCRQAFREAVECVGQENNAVNCWFRL